MCNFESERNTYARDTITVKDGKMYLGEKELPPLPHKKKVSNPLVVGDEIYVSGYELCDNKWTRTFKAWLCQHIGWWIW